MYLVGLVLLIFLPQSPKCCDYGNEPWPLNDQFIALVAGKRNGPEFKVLEETAL